MIEGKISLTEMNNVLTNDVNAKKLVGEALTILGTCMLGIAIFGFAGVLIGLISSSLGASTFTTCALLSGGGFIFALIGYCMNPGSLHLNF